MKKLKLIHLYFFLGIFIILFFLIIIFDSEKNSSKQNRITKIRERNIPLDSIHQKLLSNTPSKENVSIEFKIKLKSLEEKVKMNPKDFDSKEELANLYLASHQTSKAIELYEELRKEAPSKIEALYNLTSAYYEKMDFNKAEEVTLFILDKFPDEYKALFNLGAIKATKGEKSEARKILQDFIDKYPNVEESIKAKEYLSRLK